VNAACVRESVTVVAVAGACGTDGGAVAADLSELPQDTRNKEASTSWGAVLRMVDDVGEQY
jgi:hypothetical protein